MAARLDDTQIREALDGLAGGWSRDGDAITRDDEFEDFGEALRKLNAFAELAEAENHHPDLELHDWNRLRVTLSTHSEGGITDADVAMAERIGELS